MLLAFQLAGQSAIKHPRGQQVLTLLKAVWCESDAASTKERYYWSVTPQPFIWAPVIQSWPWDAHTWGKISLHSFRYTHAIIGGKLHLKVWSQPWFLPIPAHVTRCMPSFFMKCTWDSLRFPGAYITCWTCSTYTCSTYGLCAYQHT